MAFDFNISISDMSFHIDCVNKYVMKACKDYLIEEQ